MHIVGKIELIYRAYAYESELRVRERETLQKASKQERQKERKREKRGELK